MWTTPSRRRFVDLLTATTVATYALLVTGAITATTDAGAACTTWPACTGPLESLVGVDSALVLGHRLLSALLGALLAGVAALAWTVETSRRVRATVTLGALLFPVQVAIGAVVVLTDVPAATQLHLAVAAAIFATLLVALGWSLEGTADDATASDAATQDVDRLEEAPLDRPLADAATEAGASTDTDDGRSAARHRDRSDGRWRRFRETASAYLELTKPRLMWLLCLLALAGMALAAPVGPWPDGLTVVATLGGGVLAVGASGTFNHVLEWDRDRRMERTADRPVATARVSKANATLFGVALVVASMAVVTTFVNRLAAALTLVAVVYYSVVYTVVLKPNTSWNIAIGGGAGALPALIGWAAVTGSVGLPAVVLAGVVVVWTPAHFYNLAIVYREDYARGGYPMLPVVAGVSAARRRIVTTLGATLLATGVLAYVSPLGWLFAVATTVAGAVFLGSVVVQCRTRTDAATLRSFHASNAYLGVLLLAIVAELLVFAPRP